MSKPDRRTYVDSIEVIEVIKVRSCFGRGTPDEPFRTVLAYYDLDGKELAVVDPCDGTGRADALDDAQRAVDAKGEEEST